MATININDAEYYYELHGHGQPLVLVAGYTCDHLVWLNLLEELSKHFQVLLVDNRGVGQTKDHGQRLTVDLLANDIITLIDKLKLPKPHIVGQSMGGTIAQCIAATAPQKINKLVLMNSSAKWREAMVFAFKANLAMREQNVNFDIMFQDLLALIFGEAFLQDKKGLEKFKELFLSNPYPQSLENQQRQFNMLEDYDGRSQLRHIHSPTLVIYGIQDIISLPYESEYLAANISHAKLIGMDCAHAPPLELPSDLSDILINYLH